MAEALVAAGASIIVGTLSLVGVMVTNSRSNNKMQNEMKTNQAVTKEQINELTREVRLHNDFAQRIPVIEDKVKSLSRRVAELENYHKPN